MDDKQYSIRDLFWCVTLIGVGLGFLLAARNPDLTPVAGVLGITSIAAGLGAPFQRKGFFASLVFFFIALVLIPLLFLISYLQRVD